MDFLFKMIAYFRENNSWTPFRGVEFSRAWLMILITLLIFVIFRNDQNLANYFWGVGVSAVIMAVLAQAQEFARNILDEMSRIKSGTINRLEIDRGCSINSVSTIEMISIFFETQPIAVKNNNTVLLSSIFASFGNIAHICLIPRLTPTPQSAC